MKNTYTAIQLIGRQEAMLREQGIETHEHAGIDGFADAHAALSGKNEVSPPLNERHMDIDPADLVWYHYTKDGKRTIAVHAFLRETISTPLSRRLDRQYRRLYCDHDDEAIAGHAPAADVISGTIVYHGDLWIDKECRGDGLAGMLSRQAMIAVFLRWDPDYVWGFIADGLIQKGYGVRIGYWNCQPYGTRYNSEPTGISERDWLVWMSRADINYWLELSQQHKGPT